MREGGKDKIGSPGLIDDKLLSYSEDFETVFGSRTHLPLIQKGSDMTLIKMIGDVLLGKLTTLLFNCAPLTDMGCTFKRIQWGVRKFFYIWKVWLFGLLGKKLYS